ncbi:MAG: glycosyltransferase family 87 protein [Patescibacteria group bacterium]
MFLMESLARLFSTVAPDFNVMYLSTKDLLTMLNPYLNQDIFTGVGYPPNTLLFYSFLTLFPYQISQNIFFVISFFCLIFSIWISLKLTKKHFSIYSFVIYLLLIILSFPTKFTFGMGQNNFIALALLLLSFWFFSKGKDLLSGLFLGLVVSYKTVFLLFPLFFLLKRKWKVLFYSLITIAFLAFLTGEIFGWHLYKYYFLNVIPPLLNLEGREIYYNQGLLGFISRITSNLQLRKYLTFFISIIFVGINSLMCINKKDKNLQFSLFITSLVIIDTLSWQHHFVWLIFPFIVISQKLLEQKNKMGILLLIFSYFLVSWNFKTLPNYPVFNYLISSHVFVGSLLLYILNLLAFKKGKKISKLYREP